MSDALPRIDPRLRRADRRDAGDERRERWMRREEEDILDLSLAALGIG